MDPSEKESEGILHSFYSMHLFFPIPLLSQNYFNIGVSYGYSPKSIYVRRTLTTKGEEKQKKNMLLEDEDFDRKVARGEASIYELNTEYAIRAHGFRLSLFYLVTDFEKFDNGIKPDGDGYGYYLSYRYGFSL